MKMLTGKKKKACIVCIVNSVYLLTFALILGCHIMIGFNTEFLHQTSNRKAH